MNDYDDRQQTMISPDECCRDLTFKDSDSFELMADTGIKNLQQRTYVLNIYFSLDEFKHKKLTTTIQKGCEADAFKPLNQPQSAVEVLEIF